jgi:hypothetical protein
VNETKGVFCKCVGNLSANRNENRKSPRNPHEFPSSLFLRTKPSKEGCRPRHNGMGMAEAREVFTLANQILLLQQTAAIERQLL